MLPAFRLTVSKRHDHRKCTPPCTSNGVRSLRSEGGQHFVHPDDAFASLNRHRYTGCVYVIWEGSSGSTEPTTQATCACQPGAGRRRSLPAPVGTADRRRARSSAQLGAAKRCLRPADRRRQPLPALPARLPSGGESGVVHGAGSAPGRRPGGAGTAGAGVPFLPSRVTPTARAAARRLKHSSFLTPSF